MATATAPAPSKFNLKASNGDGGNFVPCPAGNHAAILVGIVDLGTHTDDYQGAVKEVPKVALVFELPGENDPDGKPYLLAAEFNLYFSEKSKLRDVVEKWLGRKFADAEDFNLGTLLGKSGLVNVVQKLTAKGKTVANVAGVGPLPRGMSCPKGHHDLFVYQVEDGPFPRHVDWLPRLWGRPIADVVAESREFRGKASPAAADDDIPY